jgi:hypothetical protein
VVVAVGAISVGDVREETNQGDPESTDDGQTQEGMWSGSGRPWLSNTHPAKTEATLRTERTRREPAVGARYALPDRPPSCHVDALAKLVGTTVQFDHLVASGELDIVTFGHLKET